MVAKRISRLIHKHATGPRLRYLIASGFSFGLMVGTVIVFVQTGLLSPDLAYGGAIAVSLTTNFFIYRYFIFPNQEKDFWLQASQYFFSSIGFRLTEWAVVAFLISIIGMEYIIATVLVLVVSFVSKYAFMSTLIFRNSKSKQK